MERNLWREKDNKERRNREGILQVVDIHRDTHPYKCVIDQSQTGLVNLIVC